MKDILAFLRELEVENSKERMDEHRDRYHRSRDSFYQLIEHLIATRASFDPQLEHLQRKQCVFRINRNTRFSRNKDPYKGYLAASLTTQGGKKSWKAGYYLHIQPWGQSFVAGGLRKPPTPVAQAVRRGIRREPLRLARVVGHSDFQDYFGPLQGKKLKHSPAGFSLKDKGSKRIKRSSYHCIHHFSDEQVCQDTFVENITDGFSRMRRLNHLLNQRLDESLEAGELTEWLTHIETW